jgi:hypothetical protein
MPIIPRINQTGPLAAAPNMPLDRERRPTVNNGAVIQAAGNLGRASQMPLDGNDVSAPWRAMGAVGESVMRAGSIVGALVNERQEAKERLMGKTVESAMEMAQAEIDAFKVQNAANPEAWAQGTKAIVDKTLKPFMEAPGMRESFRQDLRLMGNTWANLTVSKVQTQSDSALFGMTNRAIESSARSKFAKGDYDGGVAELEDGKKYFHPIQRETIEREGRDAALDGQVQQIVTEVDTFVTARRPDLAKQALEKVKAPPGKEEDWARIKDNMTAEIDFKHTMNTEEGAAIDAIALDPRKGLEDLDNPEKFGGLRLREPGRIEELKQRAKLEIQQRGGLEAQEAVDKVALLPPEKVNGATVDGLGVKFDYLQPIQRLAVAEALAQRQGKAKRDDEGTFRSAMAWASNVTPETDPFEVAQQEQFIKQAFSPELQEKITAELDRRMKGDKPAGIDIGPIRAKLEQIKNAGGFGEFEVPVKDEQGNLVVSKDPKRYREEPGFFYGTNTKELPDSYTPEKVTDLTKKAVADAKVGAALKILEADIQRNTIKDDAALKTRFEDILRKVGAKLPAGMNLEDLTVPGFGEQFRVNTPPPTVDGAMPSVMDTRATTSPNPLLDVSEQSKLKAIITR